MHCLNVEQIEELEASVVGMSARELRAASESAFNMQALVGVEGLYANTWVGERLRQLGMGMLAARQLPAPA